jgi:cytochrome bd-type quinol oxidase subunit 2
MAQAKSDRWIAAAKLALLSLLIIPLTVLIHELGHFAVPLLLGLPAQLHPSSISGGAELNKAAGWMVALQTGAGPLASLLMSLAGAALYGRDPRRLWALAVAICAASRFIVTSAYLGARLLFLLQGRVYAAHPNFDEHNFAVAAGLPPLLVAAAATLFLFGLIFWLLRRTEKRRRLPFALALAAGIGAGATLWVMLAPPVLATVPGR